MSDPYGSVGPPPSSGSGSSSGPQGPSAIGVPGGIYYVQDPKTGQWHPVYQGYQAQGSEAYVPFRGRETARITFTQPTFFDGDQYKPASQSPSQVAALQRSLVAAGLLTGKFQLGIWDNASVNAYEQLLGYANQAGITSATQALSMWGAQHQANPPKPPPLTVQLSNPDDLRKVFRSAIVGELGQGWSQAKIDAMVTTYQGMERAQQEQAYAMTGGGQADAATGGTVTDVPSAQAFAESQAIKQDPTGVAAHNYLGYVDQFNNIIGKWSA